MVGVFFLLYVYVRYSPLMLDIMTVYFPFFLVWIWLRSSFIQGHTQIWGVLSISLLLFFIIFYYFLFLYFYLFWSHEVDISHTGFTGSPFSAFFVHKLFLLSKAESIKEEKGLPPCISYQYDKLPSII